jgi:hypothetical protein
MVPERLKEEAMHQLMSTIANGPGQFWEAALWVAAATVHVPPRRKRRDEQLDSSTLKDIGVEPGSITWL